MPRAVGLAVHGGVVHDDHLVVPGRADVELEHVGARAHRLAERVQRVRGELVLSALVGDVQRAVLLDPGVGGGRGRGGTARASEGHDGEENRAARMCRKLAARAAARRGPYRGPGGTRCGTMRPPARQIAPAPAWASGTPLVAPRPVSVELHDHTALLLEELARREANLLHEAWKPAM